MNIDWMLLVYGLGAVTMGILIFREDLGPSFLVKEKRLGPSYWGFYADSNQCESDEEKAIVPPEPCKDFDVVVGSGAYAGGKAIHTAKS